MKSMQRLRPPQPTDRYRACSDSGIAEMRGRCRDTVGDRTPADSARGAIDAIRTVTSSDAQSDFREARS